MKREYFFSIADISFKLRLPHEIVVTEEFRPFQREEFQNGIEIEFEEIEKVDVPIGRAIFKNVSFAVYEQNGQWIRIYHDYKNCEKPYALRKMISMGKEVVFFEKGTEKFFCESRNSFSHIALEELLLQKEAMILHSSFISTKYGGILFSGPSGVGKSTQADLWVKHKRAELLNGDRTIIRNVNDMWKGYGSPYAGSSKCYVNESDNIVAIVVLQQGKENHIRRLSMSEAFRKIYSEMIVNTWNSDYINKVTDLVLQLVQGVPIYVLSATADITAVECLEKVLKEGEAY